MSGLVSERRQSNIQIGPFILCSLPARQQIYSCLIFTTTKHRDQYPLLWYCLDIYFFFRLSGSLCLNHLVVGWKGASNYKQQGNWQSGMEWRLEIKYIKFSASVSYTSGKILQVQQTIILTCRRIYCKVTFKEIYKLDLTTILKDYITEKNISLSMVILFLILI